jgi:transposase
MDGGWREGAACAHGSGGVLGIFGNPRASGLGVFRWVVERTLSWLHQNRRLRVRYERRPEIHEAFYSLGCSLICLKFLKGASLC